MRKLPQGLLGLLLLSAEALAVTTFEARGELMVEDDVQLLDTAVSVRTDGRPWDWNLTLGAGQIALDYVPDAADLFGFETRLEEGRVSGQIEARRNLSERLSLQGVWGVSDGFTGYRSLWLSNFYQQFFSGLEGLERPAPRGMFGSLGGQWAYWKDVGILQSEATFAQETIAPGYDEVIDPLLGLIAVVPLRSELNTWAWRVATENVWTPRLRTALEYRLAKQSERELRQSLVARMNLAPGRDWIVRLEAGGTHEAPGEEVEEAFRAAWVRAVLQWQPVESWFLDVSGSHYADNGEIENSIGFSSAAPEVRVTHGSVGVSYVGSQHWIRLSLGLRAVDYAPVGFRNQFFSGLYRDRDFINGQLAYNFLF